MYIIYYIYNILYIICYILYIICYILYIIYYILFIIYYILHTIYCNIHYIYIYILKNFFFWLLCWNYFHDSIFGLSHHRIGQLWLIHSLYMAYTGLYIQGFYGCILSDIQPTLLLDRSFSLFSHMFCFPKRTPYRFL